MRLSIFVKLSQDIETGAEVRRRVRCGRTVRGSANPSTPPAAHNRPSPSSLRRAPFYPALNVRRTPRRRPLHHFCYLGRLKQCTWEVQVAGPALCALSRGAVGRTERRVGRQATLLLAKLARGGGVAADGSELRRSPKAQLSSQCAREGHCERALQSCGQASQNPTAWVIFSKREVFGSMEATS